MAKFKLQPDPTFKAKVAIQVAGGKPVEVEFTFRHRSREDLEKFIQASTERPDPQTILEMASGWELSDAFTQENLELLSQNYIGASRAIFDKYIEEHTKARLGN
jgi:hypothetical protein